MSNKGRYLTEADVAGGYSEPWEEPGGGASRMRPLALGSLYPPRRDLVCGEGCRDHADVQRFVADAERVMPDLDAVTMATPPGDVPFAIDFELPEDWPNGPAVVFVEANTEGDHAPGWDIATYPTPDAPAGRWDVWARTNGYSYRGQPSVLYRVPIDVTPAGDVEVAVEPEGWGDLQGLDGEVRSMLDSGIRDDGEAFPGSGADRLRQSPVDGSRVRVTVPEMDPCRAATPPAECGRVCSDADPCLTTGLLCGDASTCVGRCTVSLQPAMPGEMAVRPVDDRSNAHQWAHLSFVVPASRRGIRRYEVRVSLEPITDGASFEEARPAKAATLMDQGLMVPVGGAEGSTVEVDFGGLAPETHYWVAIRAFDDCYAPGPIAVAELDTPSIRFTTVSPCFVATAAYGSPLEPRVAALRRFRDRHLMTNPAGRTFVQAYYAVGPYLAEWIAERDDRRAAARSLLTPLVDLVD
jgi:hypothetical protein